MLKVSCQGNLRKTLGFGDAGTDVGMLQEALGLRSTGVYGEGTAKAIAEWQARYGLPTTGYFGPMSRDTFARSARVQPRIVTVAARRTGVDFGAGAGGSGIIAVGPVRFRPPRDPTRLNPHFLICTTSYDVVSNICQALYLGGGSPRE